MASLRTVFLSIMLLACGSCYVLAKVEGPTRPNIVVILCDDLGWGDPKCYNPQSKIPTPNIDRLAREGMRFTDAHSPSAVCTPTRYGLLTGRYCWRTSLKRGVLQGYDPYLIEEDRQTFVSYLYARGYATGGFGKWHLGLGANPIVQYSKPFPQGPRYAGFETYFGIPSSLDFPPYVFIELDKVVEEPTKVIAGSIEHRNGGNGFWRAGPIAPSFKHEDVLPKVTARAVEFVRQQTSERPFCMYLPFSSPHTPWMPTSAWRGKSGADWYGDFVAQTDDAVGRVLAVLDEKGFTKNTLVIFTSDNGAHWLPSDIEKWGHRSNAAWRGQKADIHEAGHRIPFIVRWPGTVQPSTTCDQTICLTDLFATFADIFQEKLPETDAEDSFSFLPLLKGSKKPVREVTIHHSGDGMFAIRAGKWKLVEGLGSGGFTAPKFEDSKPGGPTGQLYDLEADPDEKRNLYLEQPAVVKRLSLMLEEIRYSGSSEPHRTKR
jgi:arylsulfatase A-like enzyme